jgi:hypothetical protein
MCSLKERRKKQTFERKAMTVKIFAAGAAAAAIIGAAGAGVSSVGYGSFGTPGYSVQPVALSVPLPQDPAPGQPDLPNPGQLSSLCTQVTDPGVNYETKNALVENGMNPDEGRVADHDLRKAYRDGNFPEQFNVTNIQPAGPNAATADVAISGPKFAGPVTKQLAFIDTGGGNWILQHDAAIALIQAATATN